MHDDALSLVVCGAASAMSVHQCIGPLRQQSPVPLRLLLTHSATRFVQPSALRWYADEVYVADSDDLNPTEFALRSRCVVVLPATANMLAAAALGLAATPAQTVLLSAPSPILFFPGMNRVMWQREPVKRHVATLRGDGHIVVDPPDREIFEFWRRELTVGSAPPPADQVVKIVLSRLESGNG